MLNLKISVIVPIYGVEKYLRQCLDSILNQTLKDIEIILVDDGSKDQCPEIIDEYAQKDLRIVVIHKKNTGYGDSINEGIKKASGNYIGIIDADDWIDPNMYEVLYGKAIETGAEIVKSDFYKFSGKTNQNKKSNIFPKESLNNVFKPLKTTSVMTMGPSIWTSIYKKDFLTKNKINLLATPGASYQDTGFHFKTLIAAKKVLFINQAFYHYRIDNLASSVKDQRKVFCVCDEWKEIINWAKERGIYDEIAPLLCSIQYNTYMWNWKRLSGNAEKEFIKRFSMDFSSFYEKGLIQESFLGRKKYSRVKQIIFHPYLFCCVQKLKHFPNIFLRKVRRYI